MKHFVEQYDVMDCGPACLCMIAAHYGKKYKLEKLRSSAFLGKDGVSFYGISKAAEQIGMRSVGGRIAFDKLMEKAVLPCIVHWNQDHFVVVYKVKKKKE